MLHKLFCSCCFQDCLFVSFNSLCCLVADLLRYPLPCSLIFLDVYIKVFFKLRSFQSSSLQMFFCTPLSLFPSSLVHSGCAAMLPGVPKFSEKLFIFISSLFFRLRNCFWAILKFTHYFFCQLKSAVEPLQGIFLNLRY